MSVAILRALAELLTCTYIDQKPTDALNDERRRLAADARDELDAMGVREAALKVEVEQLTAEVADLRNRIEWAICALPSDGLDSLTKAAISALIEGRPESAVVPLKLRLSGWWPSSSRSRTRRSRWRRFGPSATRERWSSSIARSSCSAGAGSRTPRMQLGV